MGGLRLMMQILNNPLAVKVTSIIIVGLIFGTIGYFTPDIVGYLRKRRRDSP